MMMRVIASCIAALGIAPLAGPRTAGAVSTTDASAVIVYPYVEVDSTRGADTVIQVTNAASEPVSARCIYDMPVRFCLNGQPGDACPADDDGPVTCSGTCVTKILSRGIMLRLTPRQPLGWRASEGLTQLPIDGTERVGPDGTSNLGSVVPPVPSDPFSGSLLCMVVGFDGRPAQRDALFGVATVWRQKDAVEQMAQYHAVGIAAGAAGDGDNTLVLGGAGAEYGGCPDTSVLPVVFEGATLTLGSAGAVQRAVTTSIALAPCGRAEGVEEPPPRVSFLVVNEFGQQFSAATELHGHLVTRLVDIDAPDDPERSVFHVATAGTLTGNLRTDSSTGSPPVFLVAIEDYGGANQQAGGDMVAFNAYTRGERPDSETLVMPALCPGDCDYDRTVGIHELVTSVNIALGTSAPISCSNADTDSDGSVLVHELVQCVGRALTGCDTEP